MANDTGVDPVRSLSGAVSFDIVHDRGVVWLPNPDNANLLDVFLTLHGDSNPYVTIAGTAFGAPADTQIHLVGISGGAAFDWDITPGVIAVLRKHLSASNQGQALQFYRLGIEEYLSRVRKIPAVYAPANTKIDEAARDAIINGRALESLLTSLGDGKTGTLGALHIFNFIYRAIVLPPVSLNAVLQVVGKGVGKNRLDKTQGLSLVFINPSIKPELRTGSVKYTVQCVYYNGLRDELAAIRNNVIGQLDTIESRLRSNAPLMQSLLDTHDQLAKALLRFDEFEKLLNRTIGELTELKAGVTSLDVKVQGLH